jgi:hypothetical protein
MDIACWNCKTVTKLDKAAVETAIAAMDASKLGFHDLVCSSCGKSNRTARDSFMAGLEAFAVAEPQLTKREATQKTKEDNARRRGDADKKERAKVKEAVKKARK